MINQLDKLVCCVIHIIKGITGVNSRDPPFTEWNFQLTMVPFKPLSDHQRRIIRVLSLKLHN